MPTRYGWRPASRENCCPSRQGAGSRCAGRLPGNPFPGDAIHLQITRSVPRGRRGGRRIRPARGCWPRRPLLAWSQQRTSRRQASRMWMPSVRQPPTADPPHERRRFSSQNPIRPSQPSPRRTIGSLRPRSAPPTRLGFARRPGNLPFGANPGLRRGGRPREHPGPLGIIREPR